MLTEFFSTYYNNIEARKYLYREFPEHYVWEKKSKCWTKRKTREVIGRINGANPTEGERYYLRLLLNHVRGPTSFANLLSYNGVQCSSFKDVAQKRGLLKSDDYISECLHEAANFHMPNALRRLFATILIFCEPVDVMRLWNIHFDSMSEDFAHGQAIVFEERVLKTLKSLDCFLESMGRSIKDFDLPIVDLTVADKSPTEKREILDELAVTVPLEDYSAASSLKVAYCRKSEKLVGCTISEFIGVLNKEGENNKFYKHLINCYGGRYMFFTRVDTANDKDRREGKVVVQEIFKQKESSEAKKESSEDKKESIVNLEETLPKAIKIERD
ncbi:hypothetical protein Vadar_014156 [Vaccinium darrowii]|uniref:Uncharacterized protein n=1 Tax=Vaccinium darrowii TaxID=229202 RepID=A0ACB7XQR7_9ERIC|nr:hypothetical protein Vadar_014156 [Vaccinium darrowii]